MAQESLEGREELIEGAAGDDADDFDPAEGDEAATARRANAGRQSPSGRLSRFHHPI